HSGMTPLMYAAWLGYPEMAALLIQAGADVHLLCDDETALFLAARHGYAEICEALLQAGADADFTNDLGETVLDVALPRKRARIAAVLERYGYRDLPPP